MAQAGPDRGQFFSGLEAKSPGRRRRIVRRRLDGPSSTTLLYVPPLANDEFYLSRNLSVRNIAESAFGGMCGPLGLDPSCLAV